MRERLSDHVGPRDMHGWGGPLPDGAVPLDEHRAALVAKILDTIDARIRRAATADS